MALNCTVRNVGDVAILDLSGLLSLGEHYTGSGSGVLLGEKVHEVIQNGSKKVILNLAGVRFVDSSGAGQLVGAYTSARNRSAELKISQPSSQVRNLLRITKLDSLIDIRDDEQSALDAFSKGAAAGA
jgi:anti-sigma B factor antagonist